MRCTVFAAQYLSCSHQPWTPTTHDTALKILPEVNVKVANVLTPINFQVDWYQPGGSGVGGMPGGGGFADNDFTYDAPPPSSAGAFGTFEDEEPLLQGYPPPSPTAPRSGDLPTLPKSNACLEEGKSSGLMGNDLQYKLLRDWRVGGQGHGSDWSLLGTTNARMEWSPRGMNMLRPCSGECVLLQSWASTSHAYCGAPGGSCSTAWGQMKC